MWGEQSTSQEAAVTVEAAALEKRMHETAAEINDSMVCLVRREELDKGGRPLPPRRGAENAHDG